MLKSELWYCSCDHRRANIALATREKYRTCLSIFTLILLCSPFLLQWFQQVVRYESFYKTLNQFRLFNEWKYFFWCHLKKWCKFTESKVKLHGKGTHNTNFTEDHLHCISRKRDSSSSQWITKVITPVTKITLIIATGGDYPRNLH